MRVAKVDRSEYLFGHGRRPSSSRYVRETYGLPPAGGCVGAAIHPDSEVRGVLVNGRPVIEGGVMLFREPTDELVLDRWDWTDGALLLWLLEPHDDPRAIPVTIAPEGRVTIHNGTGDSLSDDSGAETPGGGVIHVQAPRVAAGQLSARVALYHAAGSQRSVTFSAHTGKVSTGLQTSLDSNFSQAGTAITLSSGSTSTGVEEGLIGDVVKATFSAEIEGAIEGVITFGRD